MEKIFVLGAGTMGAGIVQAFAQKGYEVIVRDIKDAFKKQNHIVNINGQNCEILGRIGTFHVTVDITGKNIKIGDKATFEVNTTLVNSNVERIYQ